MLTVVDDRLRSEATRYRLRFRCEECAHFSPERTACANGYPVEPHRGIEVTKTRSLEFCKEFELT